MSKFNLRVLVLGWWLLAGAQPAAAQSVTLPATGVAWSTAGRENRLTTQINAADCVEDAYIDFSLVVMQPTPAYNLELWAGANCDLLHNRLDASLSNCWRIGNSTAVVSVLPASMRVRVRDILYGRTLASSPNAGPDITLPVACEQKQPSSSAHGISLYFMLVDTSEVIQGTFAIWQATYKLTPPAAPVITDTRSGYAQIHVDFSSDPSDTTLNGFQFFCEPGAGSAASGSDVPACSAPNALLPDASANNVQSFRCGSAAPNVTTGNATHLANGVSYNIAATATDSYENVSTLSNVVCQVPLASAATTDDTSTSRACSIGGGLGARGSRDAFSWFAAPVGGMCLLRWGRARGRSRLGRRRLRRLAAARDLQKVPA